MLNINTPASFRLLRDERTCLFVSRVNTPWSWISTLITHSSNGWQCRCPHVDCSDIYFTFIQRYRKSKTSVTLSCDWLSTPEAFQPSCQSQMLLTEHTLLIDTLAYTEHVTACMPLVLFLHNCNKSPFFQLMHVATLIVCCSVRGLKASAERIQCRHSQHAASATPPVYVENASDWRW